MSIFYYDEEMEIKLIREDEFEMGKEAGMAVGKAEGKAEGRAEGKAEGKAETLLIFLKKLGDIPDKISKTILSERNEDILMDWIDQAVRAEKLEEFMEGFPQK